MKTKPDQAIAMVKTTMRLPRALWRDVRVRALDEGRDFQEVVASALQLYLANVAATAIVELRRRERQAKQEGAR